MGTGRAQLCQSPHGQAKMKPLNGFVCKEGAGRGLVGGNLGTCCRTIRLLTCGSPGCRGPVTRHLRHLLWGLAQVRKETGKAMFLYQWRTGSYCSTGKRAGR